MSHILYSHIRAVSVNSGIAKLTGKCASCGNEVDHEPGLLLFTDKKKALICKKCISLANRYLKETE